MAASSATAAAGMLRNFIREANVRKIKRAKAPSIRSVDVKMVETAGVCVCLCVCVSFFSSLSFVLSLCLSVTLSLLSLFVSFLFNLFCLAVYLVCLLLSPFVSLCLFCLLCRCRCRCVSALVSFPVCLFCMYPLVFVSWCLFLAVSQVCLPPAPPAAGASCVATK